MVGGGGRWRVKVKVKVKGGGTAGCFIGQQGRDFSPLRGRKPLERRQKLAATYLAENPKLLTGHAIPLRRAPDTIVAPFHQPALQLDRIQDILVADALAVGLDAVAHAALDLQALEHGVEAGIVVSRQQQQQVEAGDFAALAGAGVVKGRRGQLVEGEELLEVAREGLGLVQPDGEQRAGFEHGAGEGEEVRGGCGGGEEGVQCEEGAFGGG